MSGICDTCGDDRFELIAKAKQKLLDATNIGSRADEIAVLDSILFRCWQMGWLDQLRDAEVIPERTCRNTAPVYLDFLCSECGFVHYHSDENDSGDGNEWNYCPNCGAKVRQ